MEHSDKTMKQAAGWQYINQKKLISVEWEILSVVEERRAYQHHRTFMDSVFLWCHNHRESKLPETRRDAMRSEEKKEDESR